MKSAPDGDIPSRYRWRTMLGRP